jgi:hypothetical protein
MKYAKEIWLEQIAVGRLPLVALAQMEINYSSTAEFENIINTNQYILPKIIIIIS